MFDYKELSTIMGALVTDSVNVKRMIIEKQYCCEEELESLKEESERIEKLINKVSNMLIN